MADQTPNPNAQANIDDLVKELSRPQTTPVNPATPTTPPAPPALAKPVMPAPAPMPAMPPKPPMSASTPAPVAPASKPASPAPQSYQSNIRTMADDMASLKTGQQPQGTTMPRTPAPSTPAPVAPASKPVIPASPVAPQNSNVSMPKPTPAPAMPKPVAPQAPAPAPLASAAPKQGNQFYVPETLAGTPKGNSRSLLFVGAGLAVVVLAVMYWFFFIKPAPEVEVPIVTATPTATAAPRLPVSSLFQGSAGTISIASGSDPFQTFSAGLKVLVVTPGQLGVLVVSDAATNKNLFPFDLFDRFSIAYPLDLKPATGTEDGVILAYGQSESFNVKGQVVQNSSPVLRLAFVTKVSNSAAASLRSWETTMPENIARLFGITPSKNTGPFSDGSYQSIPLRFKNFAFPDMTIDYALVSYNGESYMIMANSREAMYAVINVLRPAGK